MENWLFRQDKRSERLEELGDRLDFLQTLIPWEKLFRADVEKVHSNADPKLGEHPPYDALMLFKINVLQSCYNFSDKEMEYQIADRLSFQKFLGIETDARVPDSNTIRLFLFQYLERDGSRRRRRDDKINAATVVRNLDARLFKFGRLRKLLSNNNLGSAIKYDGGQIFRPSASQ